MKICVCGGGNLGHVVSGFLAAQRGNEVSVLTRHPERWGRCIIVEDEKGNVFEGKLKNISSDADIVRDSDLVILCLPGYAIHNTLMSLKKNLQPSTIVGSVVSSTGFFYEAFNVLPDNIPLFGFQRVPFISRTSEYGHRAVLKGYKKELAVAIEHTEKKEKIRLILEKLFCAPVKLLNSYYEASLSNSNPLLHPARLYTMWKDWKDGQVFSCNEGFYENWSNEASSLLIEMDAEFQQLLKVLKVEENSIPSILDYYGQTDAESLTAKIRSIPAFKGILSPMKETEHGFVPDFSSRYFTEDFPYGMRFIVEEARKVQFPTPTINKVYEWGMSKIE